METDGRGNRPDDRKSPGVNFKCADEWNPFYALELELFNFHLFRFSLGATTEEVARKRKSKSYHYIQVSNAIFRLKSSG
jgi:hypothetical protein